MNQSPYGFSKTVFPIEKVKSHFLETFNITISRTFRENFIEVSQVILKGWRYFYIYKRTK